MNRITVGLSLTGLALLACSTVEPNQVLDYGDAEWARPPFAPPGGEGDPQDPNQGDGVDGGSAPGGDGAEDGGFDDGSWGTGDEPGSDTTTGDPDPSGTSTGGTDTGGTDTVGTDTVGTDTGGTDTGGTDTAGSDTAGSGTAGVQVAVDGSHLELTTRSQAGAAPTCPDTQAPAVFYMSNDDSNSQASPVLVRHTVLSHEIVPPSRVRVHEFLNYYDLSYQNPADKPASVGMQMRRTDAALGEFVLLAYAQGQALTPEQRRPMNLVFSLDTSGSMSGPPIDRLKDSMRAMAGQLREGDLVSIVEWTDAQVVPLQSHVVTGPNDPVLVGVIDAITTGGSTDLNAGLTRAYQLAGDDYSKDRINRVVLISDGGANTGVTDIDLIANAAADSDGEGIYMVGVGVGESQNYRDELMDTVTDAGKGAYVFIDSREEADRMFGTYFIQNMTVAARNVQMELTMPWYFAITEFHGEEYSKDPAEVEPQHLAYNDAMSFHQVIQACDPTQVFTKDRVKAKVTYEDPITKQERVDELEMTIGAIVKQDASQLYKGDVVVAYAQAFIVIGSHAKAGDLIAAKQVAVDMVAWLQAAVDVLGDPEIEDMRDVMQAYAADL